MSEQDTLSVEKAKSYRLRSTIPLWKKALLITLIGINQFIYLMPKPFKGAMPYFGNRIPDILKDVESILVSGHLSQGSFQKKFESQFATLTRTKYALAVNSGGTALELVFNALNNPGAEVIIPTDTFVASASAARRASWKIRFADISSANLCLDIDGIEKTIKPETEAIMMVYMFGIIPANLNELVQLCKERNLFLIEDASHAHGASYRGQMIGSIGHAACFSMYATKIITTGEGGVITTSSEEIANRIVQLRNHGKSLTSPLFEEISNNFRLSEIQASIGIHQLELLPEIIEHRQPVAHIYHGILSQRPDMLSCLESDPESQHPFWRFRSTNYAPPAQKVLIPK